MSPAALIQPAPDHPSQLRLCHPAVRSSGGEEVGHDSLKPERRPWIEARRTPARPRFGYSGHPVLLPAGSCRVDLQMHRERTGGPSPPRARAFHSSNCQAASHGCQSMAHNFNSWPGNAPPKTTRWARARERTATAPRAGNGQPPSPGTHRGRSAQFRGMAIALP